MAFGPLLIGIWAARAAGVDGLASVTRAAPGGQRLETTIADARARRQARPNAFEPVGPTAYETAESPGEQRRRHAGGGRCSSTPWSVSPRSTRMPR